MRGTKSPSRGLRADLRQILGTSRPRAALAQTCASGGLRVSSEMPDQRIKLLLILAFIFMFVFAAIVLYKRIDDYFNNDDSEQD
jgi:hypothetical protein